VKQFVVGSAFLMFVSSLSGNITNDHAINLTSPQAHVQKIAFMSSFGDTLPPIGYVHFCRDHGTECRPAQRFSDRIQLTAAKFQEIERVNNAVNTDVAPVTDLELYGQAEVWAYPSGKGDCEDYVLLKRRLLAARGFPESTLLITVVRDENNEGHAVLTVRTDRGDLVLDNKRREVMRWADTPYTFVKRQSERNPLVWISLLPPETAPQTIVSASNGN
jgi:predicted transglutaminase-like cysteine proteinase